MISAKQHKQAMRRRAADLRQAAHDSRSRAEAAGAARDRVLALEPLRAAACVSAFVSVGSELDTGPLLRALADCGIDIGLPVVADKGEPLVFRRWRPDMVLVPGAHDIPVPPEDAAVVAPDVLIVPLLAFDRRGYRLGYGGGYYDRTLAGLRRSGRPVTAIGYAYAAQEVDAVPHDAFDQALDAIVTESETIYVNAAKE